MKGMIFILTVIVADNYCVLTTIHELNNKYMHETK